MAARFFYGTSSWSEKSWLGPFYPPGTKPADYLAFYATQFTTIECDATYHRVPTRNLARGCPVPQRPREDPYIEWDDLCTR